MSSGLSSKRCQFQTVVAMLLVNFATLVVLPSEPGRTGQLKDSPKVLVDEVWQFVNQYYVDPKFNRLDWQTLRTSLLSRTYTSPAAAYEVIRSTLAQLNDPYTRFLDPQEFGQLLRQTTGEPQDLGLELNLVGKNLQISRITINSPAAKAGVQVGDRLLSINGRSTDQMSLERAERLLKSGGGGLLVLTLSRPGKNPFSVEIGLEAPVDNTVVYQVKSVVGASIGYIRLTGFNAKSAEHMASAIAALKNQRVQGFVLDLRNNPGGLLEPGLKIARMWLSRGVIVQILEREGKTKPILADNSALTDLPLVVLVNQESASASEILAGALQDNQRATVIGTRTFGKALVQAVHELTDGSAIVVTVAHYYTPRGTDISQKGITPDLLLPEDTVQELELRVNPQLLATPRDNRFTRALEVLAGKIRTPLTSSP